MSMGLCPTRTSRARDPRYEEVCRLRRVLSTEGRNLQILHILRKANTIIYKLCIQHNSKFKSKLKHAYQRRYYVHLVSACLSESLEDKGSFRSANILQIRPVPSRNLCVLGVRGVRGVSWKGIADVDCRVVFFLFLP